MAPPMTAEQSIRGPDATVDWVLLVTGYGPSSVMSVPETELRESVLEDRGAASGTIAGVYRLQYLLTGDDATR